MSFISCFYVIFRNLSIYISWDLNYEQPTHLSVRKLFFKISQHPQENTHRSTDQVFSCEYCEIINITYFEEYLQMLFLTTMLRTTASEPSKLLNTKQNQNLLVEAWNLAAIQICFWRSCSENMLQITVAL